jgi:hypothetical protein
VLSINYDISYFSNGGKQTPGFNTNVEFIDSLQSMGPVFPEEKEAVKPGQQQPEQQSFLSKYVIISF